jgi:hypothetical protein
MPKKPRPNKRAPPKPRPAVQPQSQSQAQTQPQPNTQNVHGVQPPHSAQVQFNFNPSNQTNLLPYLDPNQPIDLSALVPPPSTIDPNDPNFPSALSSWSETALSKLNDLPKLTQSQLSAIAGAAAGVRPGMFNAAAGGEGSVPLPIDLPASLAALFEAKLTLDREKAKLMQMQRELKSHRDSLLAANKLDKGKGVDKDVVDVELEEDECTCGRHG